jgi:hypothetical protein
VPIFYPFTTWDMAVNPKANSADPDQQAHPCHQIRIYTALYSLSYLTMKQPVQIQIRWQKIRNNQCRSKSDDRRSGSTLVAHLTKEVLNKIKSQPSVYHVILIHQILLYQPRRLVFT